MYTALTASFPFMEPDDAALMQAILHKQPPRPSEVRPGLLIPPALEAVVLKAMCKDPKGRFASCAEMRRALLQIKTEQRDSFEEDFSDAPHSLDILLPEDELFEVDVDMEAASLSMDDLDDLDEPALTPPSEEPPASLATSLPRSLSGAGAAALESRLGPVIGGRRAPVIGRQAELRALQRAALLTRRGSVAARVMGDYGSGNSFFLSRGLEALSQDIGATVLLCELTRGDREYALRALSRLVGAALDEFENLQGGAPSASAARGSFRARERIFQQLNLGNLETATLHSLLTRWTLQEAGAERDRPYDDTPLRFPETRLPLLRHAFVELLRALLALQRELSRGDRGGRAPLVLAIDGWEHCDSPTRQLLRELLSQQRDLPLLLIAAAHLSHPHERDLFPEDTLAPRQPPFLDGRLWDVDLTLRPFNQDEVAQYLEWRLGHAPSAALTQRLSLVSQGNALTIKDLLQQMRGVSDDPAEQERWALDELPESAARMFGSQIDRLGRDAKMLLAVCTLLGHSFPEEAVRAVMPEGFDVDGTFTELFGARILEPAEDMQRLHFRYPLMRVVSLRRLHPKLRKGLHARIAALLQQTTFGLPSQEAELWRATHTLLSGDAVGALDVLLDSAQQAMERWEPHLALRRARQVQLWLTTFLAQDQRLRGEHGVAVLGAPAVEEEHGPEIPEELFGAVPAEALEVRAVRAAQALLQAARRLGLAPSAEPDAIIPERLPQGLLQQIEGNEALPRRLRAEAALEIGRYLSRIELPQGSRRALQVAAYQARKLASWHLLTQIEMEMARTLHRLGRMDQSQELTTHLLQALRGQIPPPAPEDPAPVRLSRALDRLAKIYIERRLYPRAEHLLDQALALAERDGDEDRLGKIYLHYAALYRVQSNHARTLQALHRALDISKRTHDLRAMARVLYNQGVTAASLGRRAEARVYLSDAAEVAINLGWPDFIALVNGQIKRL
jgi:tetratricopeptide (TPR) repeat protein